MSWLGRKIRSYREKLSPQWIHDSTTKHQAKVVAKFNATFKPISKKFQDKYPKEKLSLLNVYFVLPRSSEKTNQPASKSTVHICSVFWKVCRGDKWYRQIVNKTNKKILKRFFHGSNDSFRLSFTVILSLFEVIFYFPCRMLNHFSVFPSKNRSKADQSVRRVFLYKQGFLWTQIIEDTWRWNFQPYTLKLKRHFIPTFNFPASKRCSMKKCTNISKPF